MRVQRVIKAVHHDLHADGAAKCHQNRHYGDAQLLQLRFTVRIQPLPQRLHKRIGQAQQALQQLGGNEYKQQQDKKAQ